MTALIASAPGKAILFGEHAVVYGQPAVAIPVMQVKAKASIFPIISALPEEIHIEAPDIHLNGNLSALPEGHPIRLLISLIAVELNAAKLPPFHLKISSSIPVAAGLGSGAAISIAVIRALSAFLGRPLPNERVSALAYEIERIYHGNPSGIDNTVIAYAQPILFVRGQPFELLHANHPLTFILADSGLKSATSQVVNQVRTAREEEPQRYDRIFSTIGEISRQGCRELQAGSPQRLGVLMDENHACLQEISVSCREVDHLVTAARAAGAYGAKVSGAGQGGNMIALAPQEQGEAIAAALQKAGAVRTIITYLLPSP